MRRRMTFLFPKMGGGGGGFSGRRCAVAWRRAEERGVVKWRGWRAGRNLYFLPTPPPALPSSIEENEEYGFTN